MIAAGVPCIPGSSGPLPEDEGEVRRIARDIGYPVIVKAAGGGGGGGMRVVPAEPDLAAAVALTREEARNAFGNPELYMERYLTTPRHVEIQALCDAHGKDVHLGDRDCSVQRRHQKVIEEAPAPGVERALIDRVAERCLAACKAMGYRGAGTFEFLYEDGTLFFIEMNTRLQAEYPVTEVVTGIDIVQAQLRIAMGEPLWPSQSFAATRRINAEDPETMQPSPGTLTEWQAPVAEGLRVDTHVHAGYVVPPQYDSLITKAIAHGTDRAQAMVRLLAGLEAMRTGGIGTNIPLHLDLLHDAALRRGGTGINYPETRRRAEEG